jgi:integrase
LDYWNHHGKKVVSAQTIKIFLRDWNEFWGDATVQDVRDINRQEEFHEHLRLVRGLAPNSVNRVLEIGRAAIRRAWKRGVIDSFPFVAVVEGEHDKPMGEPLTLDQLRAFYRGSDEQHWQDFFLLMLGTGGRTGAAVRMHKNQLDFENLLISLNPKGRKQTSKFRPVVRLLPTLRERFKDRPDGALIVFHGKAVGKISTCMRIARNRAGLAPVNRGKNGLRINSYSIRHTVARYLRMEGVGMEEIATLIGHKRFGFSMSLRYAPHSPDYLAKSSEALDRLLQLVVKEKQRNEAAA